MFLGSRVIPYVHVHWKGINIIPSDAVNVHPCMHTTFIVPVGHKRSMRDHGEYITVALTKYCIIKYLCGKVCLITDCMLNKKTLHVGCFHFVVCRCLHQLYTCAGKVMCPHRFVIKKIIVTGNKKTRINIHVPDRGLVMVVR
jgi:hypothetical protein